MTMNLDELRDWHVKRLGWRQAFRHRHASGVEQWWWERDNGDECQDHPIPATLDAIAGLMPSGWEVFRVWQGQLGEWRAYVRIGEEDQWRKVVAPDTGDELLDRARLAWLAWEAEAKGAANG
jgi:hypothetical protein